MHDRCCRCHITLTSEDKYHYSISCETCNEDAWYAEHFDYFPIRCAWRYAAYQVRWLRETTSHGLRLCLRPLLRRMDARRKLQHVRRER